MINVLQLLGLLKIFIDLPTEIKKYILNLILAFLPLASSDRTWNERQIIHVMVHSIVKCNKMAVKEQNI